MAIARRKATIKIQKEIKEKHSHHFGASLFIPLVISSLLVFLITNSFLFVDSPINAEDLFLWEVIIVGPNDTFYSE